MMLLKMPVTIKTSYALVSMIMELVIRFPGLVDWAWCR